MALFPLRRMGICVALLAEVLLLTILTSSFGQSLTILSGGIDLSAGSLPGFSGVVTGVLLREGFGIPITILGLVVGSLYMGVLRNGLALLDVSAYWQQVAIGLVIILAVVLDRKTNR